MFGLWREWYHQNQIGIVYNETIKDDSILLILSVEHLISVLLVQDMNMLITTFPCQSWFRTTIIFLISLGRSDGLPLLYISHIPTGCKLSDLPAPMLFLFCRKYTGLVWINTTSWFGLQKAIQKSFLLTAKQYCNPQP